MSLPQRQLLWERLAQGHSAEASAEALGLAPSTARKPQARCRAPGGAGFIPDYGRGGRVSVSNRGGYVGRAYARQPVWVRFDPQQRWWLSADRDNHLLNRPPARAISAAKTQRLTGTHRRKG